MSFPDCILLFIFSYAKTRTSYTIPEKTGYNISDQYATYFLTFTFVGWLDLLTRVELKDMIVDSLKYCQQKKGLIINSYVLMPSHMHIICRATEASDGLSNIIRDFKKFTAKEIIYWIENEKRESRSDWLKVVLKYHTRLKRNKSKYQVWKKGNHPMQCLHPKFTLQRLNYIHNNPVKDGYVFEAEDYKYSSARNYLNQSGLIDVELIDFGVQEGYVFS